MQFLNPIDKIEIITLDDNYVNIAAMDNTDIVSRANGLVVNELRSSVLAEHGFGVLIRATAGAETRDMIMDFGFSEDVAIRNAKTLNLDLTQVEAAVLSHGHIDHFGGFGKIAEAIGHKNVELFVHPSAFKPHRFILAESGSKIVSPSPIEEDFKVAGFKVLKTSQPTLILNGTVLFLGEIPRLSDFEHGMPQAFYDFKGKELPDLMEDDTAIVMNLSGKGLVIVSGCAHAGIINTVDYAKKVTGISQVHAIMGGFHLSGQIFEPIIASTVNALKEIRPDYVVPTHCTGRKAVAQIEQDMSDAFILNMAGTILTFSAGE